MCFISRLFIYSMFYSFVDLSINGHGSVASWRSSRADVFFWSPVALAETGPRLMEGPQHKEEQLKEVLGWLERAAANPSNAGSMDGRTSSQSHGRKCGVQGPSEGGG